MEDWGRIPTEGETTLMNGMALGAFLKLFNQDEAISFILPFNKESSRELIKGVSNEAVKRKWGDNAPTFSERDSAYSFLFTRREKDPVTGEERLTKESAIAFVGLRTLYLPSIIEEGLEGEEGLRGEVLSRIITFCDQYGLLL